MSSPEESETTIEALRDDAEQGDSWAQYQLGQAYDYGKGIPEDDAEAVRWYRKAAEQGVGLARIRLEVMDALEEGVPNYIHIYQAVVEQKTAADASYNLGAMKFYGHPAPEQVRKNKERAEEGEAGAQHMLGLWYAYGEIAPQYDAAAVELYEMAAEQGHAWAQTRLGYAYFLGYESISKDHEQAAHWLRKAAEQGDVLAQYLLGTMYLLGLGVSQNTAEAVRWYKEPAEQGWDEAQFNLGVWYGNSNGGPEDDAKAVHWYRKAAEQGHAAAQVNLAVHYRRGLGTAQDIIQAYAWNHLVASQNIENHLVEVAVQNRERFVEKMTDTEIAEARRLAQEYQDSYGSKIGGFLTAEQFHEN